MQRPHRRAAALLLSLGLNEEERSDSNRKDDRQEGNQREVAARAAARILPEGILATVADASRDDARAACTCEIRCFASSRERAHASKDGDRYGVFLGVVLMVLSSQLKGSCSEPGNHFGWHTCDGAARTSGMDGDGARRCGANTECICSREHREHEQGRPKHDYEHERLHPLARAHTLPLQPATKQ